MYVTRTAAILFKMYNKYVIKYINVIFLLLVFVQESKTKGTKQEMYLNSPRIHLLFYFKAGYQPYIQSYVLLDLKIKRLYQNIKPDEFQFFQDI